MRAQNREMTVKVQPAALELPVRFLDCGGKRSATPLLGGRKAHELSMIVTRAKAPSPLRFAGAVQNGGGQCDCPLAKLPLA